MLLQLRVHHHWQLSLRVWGVKKETVKSEKVDREGPVQQPPAVKAEAKGAPLFKRRKRE